jgi:hypothetical protein
MTQNGSDHPTPDALAAQAIYKCWKELRAFIMFIILATSIWQLVIYIKAEKQRAAVEELMHQKSMRRSYSEPVDTGPIDHSPPWANGR